ncbi:focadhesin [Anopheles maculipalpis]|uniref:focadhesin n=1 Tax=Anopheles maculipalpis TaxID=1496333 RepID=UPI00215974F7|nr:focadhesin [Anopheles maculipalpis]
MHSLQAVNSRLTLQSAASQIANILKAARKTGRDNPAVIDDAVNVLKQLFQSNNIRICQLAIEAALQLTMERYVEPGQMLGILMTLLPNSNSGQCNALTSILFHLLKMDLRQRCTGPSSMDFYQHGFEVSKHPLILLFDKSNKENRKNILDRMIMMMEDRDGVIYNNIIEFLHTVLLHVFINVGIYDDCRQVWKLLVRRTIMQDSKAKWLLFQILSWCSDATATQTFFTVGLLTDALEIVLDENLSYVTLQLEYAVYLAVVLKNYIENNFDPSRCFSLLRKFCTRAIQRDPPPNLDVLLTIATDLLSYVSPRNMLGLLEIIQTILPFCGKVSCMLTKEAMVQLLGQSSYIMIHMPLCEQIFKTIEKDLANEERWKEPTPMICDTQGTMYFHEDLAKWTILCEWWNSHDMAIDDYLVTRGPVSVRFSRNLSQLHRSIFLSSSYDENVWKTNLGQLVNLMKDSEVQVAQSMVPLLYGLAHHRDARRRLHVLQTVASMGAKENLIGILKAFTKDLDRAMCLDLYLRLWKAEPRTYPLLYDLLKDTSRQSNEDRWEYTIARAYTIREVCLINPTQHGEDLVNLFSEVLSNPNNNENEVAICLSLDAISSLCENQVVNIVSTWKVLGFRFADERRPKVIKSLCRFFANVPLIKVTSPEQEVLVNHIISTLWHYVTDYKEREIIEAALGTLKHFLPDTLTLRQIPELFRQGIELPEQNNGDSPADAAGSVPPECWIQLLQYTNHCAIEAVGDLVSHYITHEIGSYRGGVYQTPAGRPEPSNLKYLPRASILSTILHYLILQSTKFTKSESTAEIVLLQMLRIIAKPYPKPIPPLNWCFLHEYFHHCFEMRDACLQIAIKQMPFSGTAKRLVENYLNELCETIMLEEDLLKIYASIANITDGVQPEIYKSFVHLSLQYLSERAQDKQFGDNAPFIQTMTLIGGALQRDKKYENEDNYLLLCTTLENFFMRFDLGSEVFKKYIETLVHLPEQHFAELLKPSTWTGAISVEKLEKTIYLQFAFHQYNPTAKSLHFVGLSDIIATLAKKSHNDGSLRAYFLQEWFSFVERFARYDESDQSDGKALVGFIAELIGMIQCKLIETDDSRMMMGDPFMVDTLMTAVISFSGYGGLYGGKMIANDEMSRLKLFPLALLTVLEQNVWREIEIKIFEFLFSLYFGASFLQEYNDCLMNTFTCCKKQHYFKDPKNRRKLLSL